ncbi:IclR family transcriptional regulator [Pectobacterium polonicum]|uniref:IclR family transcriptional regulator n=1 Tax=Pectobacterium polonicum TaxID=2485124 RepID=A0ABV1PEC0_9GAMM|nr:IclR family transcriptional regulator [Pectobacterium polonicum]MDC9821484.1 IclR family transcriptional regulator [Pectobacterium polonicum]TKY81247.1 IclR family transcriptional regulator [Pectobacterium polonicum]GKW25704.1 IclR family transcriptional regulator [Pectobacterium carotovorum subsp. carotovorum]
MNIFQQLEHSKAPAAVRLVMIVDYIAKRDEASFTEICTDLSIPKSSVHHLLEVLVVTQLLRQRADGRYVLGLRLFELGGLVIKNIDLRKDTINFMHELVKETELTCHLGILDGDNGFFLSKVESPKAIVKTSWEGKKIIFNRMSLGKVLVAWLPQERIESLIANCTFEYLTPRTITNKDDFLQHLKTVKEQGWAIDDGEDIEEICCMAAPIFNQNGEVIAAIGVNGMQSQYANGKKEKHLASLIKTSKAITAHINSRNIDSR